MKAAFHYIVKAKVIRQIKENEFDFEEINEKFENENPIIAREDAFHFYQSWIDVLLQHKGKEYISDKEAREDLVSFVEPGVPTKLEADEKEIEFSDKSLGNGIGVFFVPDIYVVVESSSRIEVGAELLIHGIGNFGRKYMIDDNICILGAEAEYYEYFNYETNNEKTEILYCFKCWYDDGYDKERAAIKILKTPFDWTGYDKLFWWGDPESEKETEFQAPESIAEIIEQGESNQVEFKRSLHSENGKINEKIFKSICAFLNTNGGFMFIGVNDDKTIEGLDFDFNLTNGKNPKDSFLLEFDNILESVGLSNKSNISGQFYEIEGKWIYCIEVTPSKRLIFMKGREYKELWIRGEASTRQIRDAEEIINYWKDKQLD